MSDVKKLLAEARAKRKEEGIKVGMKNVDIVTFMKSISLLADIRNKKICKAYTRNMRKFQEEIDFFESFRQKSEEFLKYEKKQREAAEKWSGGKLVTTKDGNSYYDAPAKGDDDYDSYMKELSVLKTGYKKVVAEQNEKEDLYQEILLEPIDEEIVIREVKESSCDKFSLAQKHLLDFMIIIEEPEEKEKKSPEKKKK